MPTNPDGALGSLDYKKEERRALAIKSREAAPRFGNPERQKLIVEIHQCMLSKVPPVPRLPATSTTEEQANNSSLNVEAQIDPPNTDVLAPAEEQANQQPEHRIVENVQEVRVNAATGRLGVSFSAGVRLSRRVPAAAVADEQQLQRRIARVQKPMDDRLFTWAAFGLTIAIVVLLVKKFSKSNGLAGFMDAP